MYAIKQFAQATWCWREFSLPLWFILGAWQTNHGLLAILAAATAACVLVLLLLTDPGRITRAWERCRLRNEALDRQVEWPRVCRSLGWTRRMPDDAFLVPDLVSWRQENGQIRVLLRPLPEQTRGRWDEMADALRRALDGASVQWREAHGTLTILISRVGLPDRLPWKPGRSDYSRIVIGQRHGGASLALEASRTPHMLFAGATGSGKGGSIRSALAGALEAGWQAVVLDPKESGEYRWVDRIGVPVLTSIEEQVNALQVIDAVRQRRQALIRQAGVDNWRQLQSAEQVGWRPVLVVADEAADLLVPVKGKSEEQRERAAAQQEAARLISEIARKGRSAGIHLIVAIQRPDTAQLGEHGGALRNNLTARLALGTLDSEGVRMLGISSADSVTQTLDGTPGRGICVGFGDDPRPSACQVAWCEQAQVGRLIAPASRQGLDELEPTAQGLRDIPELRAGEEAA